MSTHPRKRWEPTPEQTAQRQVEIEARQAELVEGIAALTGSDEWRAMLDITSRLHTYSFMNSMLIAMQRPGATMVARRSYWVSIGRHPAKGQQGLFVRRPWETTIEDEETGERKPVKVPGKYAWSKVWDVSQTDGKPLPDIGPKLLQGEAPGVLWDHTVEQLGERGYDVKLVDPDHKALTPGANGTTNPKDKLVVIRNDIPSMAQLKTGVHELAHVDLGHVDDLAEYQRHRGRAETEAESVAYIVMGAAGIDASTYSFGYIASWSGGDQKLIVATAMRVTTSAHRIVDAMPEFAPQPLLRKEAHVVEGEVVEARPAEVEIATPEPVAEAAPIRVLPVPPSAPARAAGQPLAVAAAPEEPEAHVERDASPLAVRRDVGRLVRQYVTDVKNGKPVVPVAENDPADVRRLWDAGKQWFEDKGYSVSIEPCDKGDGTERTGSIDPETRTVRVAPNVDKGVELLCLLHEAAHPFLPSADAARSVLEEKKIEVAAEMTATVVALYHGVDLRSHSVAYGVFHSSGGEKLVAAVGEQVVAIATQLIKELDVRDLERAAETAEVGLALVPSGD